VRHAEHAPWRSEVFPAPKTAQEREVRLGLGGRVTARLIGPDGAPVAGGQIEHQAPSPDGGFTARSLGGGGEVTNASGEVVYEHLEPGTHRFRRAKPSGGGFFTEGGAMLVRMTGMPGEERGWVEVLVAEGGASEVELIAPPEVTVTGRVREAGDPLAGATVELVRREEDGSAGLSLPMLGGGGPQAETDGEGRYRLEGVEPGEYTLRVRHSSRAMAAEVELVVGDADVRRDVDLSVAIIEGSVTDGAGQPLAGVRVWPERARPEGSPQTLRVMAFATTDGGGATFSLDGGGFGAVQARTDADGRYQLRGVAPDVELQVRAEGEGVQPARSEELRLAHDEVRRNVDLVLATAGRIEVQAFRADGSPARNVLVTAEPAEGTAGEQQVELVGDDGRVVLDSLAPGTWRLTARTVGPEETAPIPEQSVVVVAGEQAQATFNVP
jgi:protocatechuate 3,4-dioxygenase beta subunit